MNISQILADPNIISEAKHLLNHFHENPEISNHEIETSKFLKQYVKGLGFEILETSGTGFIAIWDTGRAGRTLALRTDIDALPIQESVSNLKQKKKGLSKYNGVMHACGHDAHMSILLIVLKIISKYINHFNGKIIGIFEEGEENASGYQEILEPLANQSVDAIYGNHVLNTLDTGKVSIQSGPVMAAYGVFDFIVKGKSGHGSRPDQAINPILASTQIINALNIAWNTQLDVEKIVTLGITKFNAGSTLNIIPDTAEIGGTIRFFDLDEGKKAMELIKNISNNIAELHQCKVDFKVFAADSLPVVNDDNLTNLAQASISSLFPHSLVEQGEKWYASETFSFYSRIAPTIFAFIGIKNDNKGTGAEHHSSEFEVDGDALLYGIGSMLQFSVDYLNN